MANTSVFDPAYEFDAPQFYNFRRTSTGDSDASAWFDDHQCTPGLKHVECASAEPAGGPLTDVSNTVQKAKASHATPAGKRVTGVTGAATRTPRTAGRTPAARKANIVTSWGPAAQVKPTAAAVAKPEPAVAVNAKAQPSCQPALPPAAPVPVPAARHSAAQRPVHATPKRRTWRRGSDAEGAPGVTAAVPFTISPRVTRSVTKKRLEEQAALQFAQDKAAAPRGGKAAKRAGKAPLGAGQGMGGTRTANAKLASKPTTKPGPKAALQRVKAGGVQKACAAPAGRTTAKPAARRSPAARKRVLLASAASHRAPLPLKNSRDRLLAALRPRRAAPARSTKPLTLPASPKLHGHTKASKCLVLAAAAAGGSKTPFKPLAVKVREFHTKTPARFKRHPEPVDPHPAPLPITMPQEPCLATAARARPPTIKPREVEEAEAMAAMPPFHAQPLRPEVLRPPLAGPRTTERRPPTQPLPFSFVTDDRAARRQALAAATGGGGGPAGAGPSSGQPAQQFKALPLDSAILEAPAGLPKRSRFSLTIPISPLLLTKKRSHAEAAVSWSEVGRQEFKARPVPTFLHVPWEQVVAPGGREPPALTEPRPFGLRTEQRGAAHAAARQARLAEEAAAEAEARRVKALALPATTVEPAPPPRPEPKPLTVPQPFALQSQARHGQYVAEFHDHVAAREAAVKADAQFKARPMWRGVPYALHPADAPLTVPHEVPLATAARAAERHDFDAAVEQKMRAAEAERAAAAEAAARAEAEAVREYRRSLRFTALPAPAFPEPKPVAPSSKPLTKPKTPKLGRKRKAADEPTAS